MQAAEKRQMESVKTLYNAVYKLRQKVADLTLKVDTQGPNSDWPHYLSTLALCASELSEIRKVLESDRFVNEHTLVLTPTLLNPEPDPSLAKATEKRLSLFNHDTVPQYLRTKLDPKLETQCHSQMNRASSMPSEQLTKLINLANRAIDSSVREVNILKQELEADFSDRQNKSMSSTEDLNAMIAAITLGKGLISFSQ
ncbi:Mediator of RNA polymerase II transcription [Fasciolopsis buskii]|uniref:Mediator of RNA polymerase II transcription subunit 8 n=1 Tax=Fasciolopsis buskii TaxID=27845 RepID=A0A8E0RUC9_9TREM|nr:Mediator of RNA polymerase II transcription [Fasciolopsis buski]